MGEKITNVQDHYSMLTLLKAVRPSIRKKMLLQKVDTFEKAINVLLSEEQANSDARQCSGSSSEPPDAEVFATSAYKRDQRSERQSFSTNSNMPEPGYVCSRCRAVGKHFSVNCPAISRKCTNCDKVGHYAPACRKSFNRSRNAPSSGSGHANAIRAYVERLSPNDLAVFNAQQIEKAENNGLVYNVETNDVENLENMTRHQRAGMFGHLN